jgi:hypothetical protein
MKILKYKSFSETMQFAVLKNADKLAKEENDRRKAKREEESNVDIVSIETKDKPNFGDDIQMDPEEGSEEMSPEEGSEEMSPEEGSEEMSPEEGSGEPF